MLLGHASEPEDITFPEGNVNVDGVRAQCVTTE